MIDYFLVGHCQQTAGRKPRKNDDDLASQSNSPELSLRTTQKHTRQELQDVTSGVVDSKGNWIPTHQFNEESEREKCNQVTQRKTACKSNQSFLKSQFRAVCAQFFGPAVGGIVLIFEGFTGIFVVHLHGVVATRHFATK